MMTILIDNGHGSDTAGKRSPDGSVLEYLYNRQLANGVYNKLCEEGIDARLLVEEDTDISIKERIKRIQNVCNSKGCDNVVLVSIHLNALGDGTQWNSAHGWEAWIHTNANTASKQLAKIFYQHAEREFVGQAIRKHNESSPAYQNNFGILSTQCASILTENFFMTNIDDANYLKSVDGHEAIVAMHVAAIKEYINSPKDEESEEEQNNNQEQTTQNQSSNPESTGIDVDLSSYNIISYAGAPGMTREEVIEEAKKYLESFNQNGIEGSLTLFGDLALRTGTIVNLQDDMYPAKNGKYMIEEVHTTFGVNGYRQTIKLPYCVSRNNEQQ